MNTYTYNNTENAFLGIAILLIAIIIIVIIFANIKKKKQIKKQEVQKNTNDIQKQTEEYPYKKRYLLTKREWSFYKELLKEIDQEKQVIIAKIRLADLIEVDTTKIEKGEKQKYFQKISQKHIDFAICKKENLEIIKLIELDDTTHDAKKRIERDVFVDKSLRKSGYVIIHVNTIEEYKTMLQ